MPVKGMISVSPDCLASSHTWKSTKCRNLGYKVSFH